MIEKIAKFFKKSFTLALFLVFASVILTSCGKQVDNTYSISGYVYDELGAAVKDVEIKSDLGSVFTDENGKYVIEGVSASLILEPSIEGYEFEEKTKTVLTQTDSANFVAYKKYDVIGTVENNGELVSDAKIVMNSLSGKYTTVTDDEGKFYGRDVAGKTLISCTVDNFSYYDAVASISSPKVVISALTDLTINFNFDTVDVDYSDIKVYIDEVLQDKVTSAEQVFSNVKCQSVVRLESSKYIFSKSIFKVDSLRQVEEIDAKEIYYVNGKVSSGDTPLCGARVYVDDNFYLSVSSSNGEFTIPELCGEKTIRVEYKNYKFEEKVINHTNKGEQLVFNGTKDVKLLVDADKPGLEQLGVVGAEFEVLSDHILVKDVQNGSEISLTSKKYHLSDEMILVGSANEYSVSAEAYFDGSVSTLEELNVKLYLSRRAENLFSEENLVEEEDLKGLFGAYFVSAKYENYVFDIVALSFDESSVSLDYKIPYSVTLEVFSGEGDGKLILSDAYANINGSILCHPASDGKILIENLLGENEVVVHCDGYVDRKLNISPESAAQPILVNFSYEVSGIVLTGQTPVSGAKVSSLDSSSETVTDTYGRFTLTLSGKNTLTVSKENYDFDGTIKVTKSTTLEFRGTYTILGTLTDENGKISSEIFVCLYDTSTNELVKYLKTSSGTFYFLGLDGEYYLMTKTGCTEEGGTLLGGTLSNLNPKAYSVLYGGKNYNFSSKGYSISGKVTSGDLAVEGANVYAGGSFTTTDRNGEYTFELLTEECTVTVKKSGFEFSQEILVSEDSKNVNFDGTYSVSSKVQVKGSNIAVSGVKVYRADDERLESELAQTGENGEFTVSGLSGTIALKFVKEGYAFDGSVTVRGTELDTVLCKICVSISVKTGDVLVEGFEYFVGGESKGRFEDEVLHLELCYGDRVSFEKEGYVISEIVVTEPKHYDATSSYCISGVILSGEVEVSGVTVSCGENSSTSISNGTFSLSGLVGKVKLFFEKDGFKFDVAEGGTEVSGYTNEIRVQASYSISGKVVLGSDPLDGVCVKLFDGTENEQTFTTLADGKFEFSGIYGRFNLELTKETFTFASVVGGFGNQELLVNAYFIISGEVYCGSDNPLNGADVIATISGSNKVVSTKTKNGKFMLEGLTGNVSILVQKDGYSVIEKDGITVNSSDRLKLKFNLTYSVTFQFDTTNVVVSDQNGVTYKTGSSDKVTITKLEGTNKFTFEKQHTTFLVDQPLEISGPVVYPKILTTTAYDVSVIITASGANGEIAAQGIKVIAGGVAKYTDASGRAEFKGVNGRLYISETENSYKYEKNIVASISSDMANVSFSIPAIDFAVIMYEKAIKNLDTANSVQIFANGTVTPSMGGNQSVTATYRRSGTLENGNIIKQNLNSGNEVAGINPTVALVIVRDNGAYYTSKVDSINGNIGNYGALTKKDDPQFFKNTYGALPTEYSPYKIDKSTISSASIVLENNSYKISYTLGTSSQPNYEKQINQLKPSGTNFKGFSKFSHTMTISKSGWLETLVTDEAYTVNKVLDITCTSNITYEYLTRSKDETIGNISKDDLAGSLQDPRQKTISLQSLNVIDNLIYTKGGSR